MKYHCYISAYESVYISDVEAGTPAEAAEKAATEHGQSGEWTVLAATPVFVNVAMVPTYEARERQP